ncbi:hypothetical protein LNQ49_03785 [Flavobacterium sp. F-65]|uniref:NlpE N-terminal domain-containing protein n=1 Tax=Flavobacterium pisciphilum TaxID=2893755 RepID=A0ABS8MPM1_9FLAO|nr:hypothetical protein [Flavobacterium sp. F-65]MCC9070722.1 hypothetical protein [Flavobacterium sp. F-65]
MKHLIILFSLFFLQVQPSQTEQIKLKDSYKIIRIDSINNVYSIYARRENLLFKILSLKNDNIDKKLKKIKCGENYKLQLISLLEGDSRYPINIDGIDFHGQTIELERDSINDLYITKNLIGLYYKSDCSK